MNFKFLVISFLLASCSTTYDYRFSKKIEKTEYVVSTDEISGSSVGTLDDAHIDIESLKGITLYQINFERRKRNLNTLEVDSVIAQISQTLLNDFKSDGFIASNSWRRKRQAVKNVLQIQGHKNKLCSMHAFTIDILDLPVGDNYHFVKADGESSLHLYEGRKPTVKDKEKEDFEEPDPLSLVDGEVFAKRIIERLSRVAKYEIYNRAFSTFGISYKIDKRTMYNMKRPRIYGIIIFGGKRTQKVKIHPKITEYEEGKGG